MNYSRRAVVSSLAMAAALPLLAPIATAQTADKNAAADRKIDATLKQLYGTTPLAKELAPRASGILVFPRIVKAGFLFGAAYGDGVLRKSGVDAGAYRSTAASYGLQAGVQWFGYALFFMNEKALSYLDRSDGWEIGVGPSVVVVDAGLAKRHTSSTLTQDIYAFIFSQKGLMAGLGLEGSKITKL
ncbi:MAG TPA: YSC84-related protein [Stellaceae bacterium]|nr:YSC84-related protein [Stellaceae bacterium]